MIGKLTEEKYNIWQFIHSEIFNSGVEVIMLEEKKPMWVEIIHDSNVINSL